MIAWLLAGALAASSPPGPETAPEPVPAENASEAYAVARPGDSRMACLDLKAAVEAIDAEILAQDEAFMDERKRQFAVRGAMTQAYGAAAVASSVARVPFSDAGLAAARTGIRTHQRATMEAGVASRQTVILRQVEMRRRINHLTEIYFAKDCALTAEADPPK